MIWGRIVFDNLFNFIILILIIQIISGIIIDTFSNLREKQEYVNEDVVNRCFICGLSRDDIEKLEKSKNAFHYHTKVISLLYLSIKCRKSIIHGAIFTICAISNRNLNKSTMDWKLTYSKKSRTKTTLGSQIGKLTHLF
jgi:hypothetical protein